MRPITDYLSTLTVPGGDHAGGPFVVLPWERRFINGAFAVPGDCALSIARGNGKSAVVAGIATAFVDPDGPELFKGRADCVVVASSFAQARIIFEDCLSYLRAKDIDLDNRRLWRLQDSQNAATVEHKPTGKRVRCIGSDPKRAHGLRPALVLCDEPCAMAGTYERCHARGTAHVARQDSEDRG